MYATVHRRNCEILNMDYVGTRYGERIMTEARSTGEIKRSFESQWFYLHGAPKRLSSDHEFCRSQLYKYLSSHSITLHTRPSRSSNKCGRVERNNGVFKFVLERLQKADATASADVLITRSSFMTNVFPGTKILSAFQVARGYFPSILGMPTRMSSQDLINAHTVRESTRALERILRSHSPTLIDRSQLHPGTEVLIY